MLSTANSKSFKIAQKTAFEAKGRQYIYTKGKVIQRLFISIYIHSDLSLQVKQMVNPVYLQ